MDLQVIFVTDPLKTSRGDRLGSFTMSAVPDVGEAVRLKDVDYLVVSRSWEPTGGPTRVTVTVRPADSAATTS